MKQITLDTDTAWEYTQALGDLASARFRLGQLVQRILADHGVDPTTPHQFDGNVLTVHSEAPDA